MINILLSEIKNYFSFHEKDLKKEKDFQMKSDLGKNLAFMVSRGIECMRFVSENNYTKLSDFLLTTFNYEKN